MAGIVTIRTALVTVAFVAAAGFVMQHGSSEASDAASNDVRVASSVTTTPVVMATNANGSPVFGLPDVVTKPSNHTKTSRSTVAVRAVYAELEVPNLGTIMATPIPGCEARITARPAAQAIVELTAVLPCAPDSDILVRHAFLEFSARTDADGRVQVSVPALTAIADFAILIRNMEHAQISLPVPAVQNLDRAVLQWRGRDNLQWHAFEKGAGIGDPGHVWSAAITDATGTRGSVHRLGTAQVETPYLAEIYTYPTGYEDMGDSLSLQIGVAVTPQNCERGVDAISFHLSGGELILRQDIAATLPDCDAVGTIVMLGDQFGPVMQAMR